MISSASSSIDADPIVLFVVIADSILSFIIYCDGISFIAGLGNNLSLIATVLIILLWIDISILWKRFLHVGQPFDF